MRKHLQCSLPVTPIPDVWRYTTPKKNPLEPTDSIGMIPMSTPEMRVRIDAITLWRRMERNSDPPSSPRKSSARYLNALVASYITGVGASIPAS